MGRVRHDFNGRLNVCSAIIPDMASWPQEGVVSSGNSLDFTKEDMERMLRHGVAVKEMEAAAIAWSAHLFGTPMFALKSITDIVDGAALEACSVSVPSAQAAVQRKIDLMPLTEGWSLPGRQL